MVYDKIRNPHTGKWVLTNGKLGKKILRNYITILNGGAVSEPCPYSLSSANALSNRFNLNECSTEAWKQQNLDCWLDSALYALFINRELSVYSNNILDKLISSSKQYKIDLGVAIRNYLSGLNNEDFSVAYKKQCKQYYKNIISHKMIDYCVNVLGYNAISLRSSFGGIDTGDINRGLVDLIFKVFENELSDKIKLITRTGDISAVNQDDIYIHPSCSIVTNKRKYFMNMVNCLKSMTISKDIVFLLSDSAACNDDLTRLTELKNFKDNGNNQYKLISYTKGLGVHYVAGSECSNPGKISNWYQYDNQGNPKRSVSGTTIESADNTLTPFTSSSQIVLVFIRTNPHIDSLPNPPTKVDKCAIQKNYISEETLKIQREKQEKEAKEKERLKTGVSIKCPKYGCDAMILKSDIECKNCGAHVTDTDTFATEEDGYLVNRLMVQGYSKSDVKTVLKETDNDLNKAEEILNKKLIESLQPTRVSSSDVASMFGVSREDARTLIAQGAI